MIWKIKTLPVISFSSSLLLLVSSSKLCVNDWLKKMYIYLHFKVIHIIVKVSVSHSSFQDSVIIVEEEIERLLRLQGSGMLTSVYPGHSGAAAHTNMWQLRQHVQDLCRPRPTEFQHGVGGSYKYLPQAKERLTTGSSWEMDNQISLTLQWK